LTRFLTLVIALASAMSFGQVRAQTVPPPGAVLPGHVPSVVTSGQATLVGPHDESSVMDLSIGLALRDQQGLDQTLSAIDNPRSSQYRQYLTQDQVNAWFDPTASEESSVVGWLRSNGLTVTHTYPNHLIVDAQGTVGQVEQMLHLAINDYRITEHTGERDFYAPSANPSIDASIAGFVSSIVGLDDYHQIHFLNNGTAHNTTPYYPQDMANAYDVTSLWNAGGNGAGDEVTPLSWTV